MRRHEVAIIVPCYNEKETILKVYKRIKKYGKILIVDDCSIDGTKKILLNKKIKFYLGDVIISYQYMNNPRSTNNLNFKKKVIKIFIHGFLHLLGYDHINEKDFVNMLKEEERIFNFVERKIDKIIKI